MKASSQWLASSGAEFSAGSGTRGCAHLSHYTVNYQEWGDGPPLVIIPGLAGGYELLGPLAQLLSRRYRVISYHLRGEENCFALRQPFALDDLVGDLDEFLTWRGLERPPILGVSFGGLLGLGYAARFPSRLDRLIVQGVGARFHGGLLQQVAGTVLNRYPLPADNPFINQFFNLLFGKRQRRTPLFDFVTRLCWQTDQSVMAHRFRLVEAFDLGARLGRVAAPTLVLAGDRDVLVTPQNLAELCDGLPDAEFRRLPGCGHLAFVTRPDLVAQHVGRFLAAGEASAVA